MTRQSTVTRRRLLGIVLLFILSLVLLSVTSSPAPDRALRWYETLFFGLITPFQKGAMAVRDTVGSVIRGYFYLVDVEQENRVLRATNRDLQEQMLLHQELIEETNRLRTLLEFQKYSPWQTVAARVIGYDPEGEFRLITIDRGTQQEVRRHMPVVAAEGLVGQIYRSSHHSSQVLLITDPTSAVDGRLVETEARGLLVGRLFDTDWDRRAYLTALEFVDRVALVPIGAMVLTSGMDGVFPGGIPIGRVTDVAVDSQGIFQEATVVPQVELMAVREVLVIVNGQTP